MGQARSSETRRCARVEARPRIANRGEVHVVDGGGTASDQHRQSIGSSSSGSSWTVVVVVAVEAAIVVVVEVVGAGFRLRLGGLHNTRATLNLSTKMADTAPERTARTASEAERLRVHREKIDTGMLDIGGSRS